MNKHAVTVKADLMREKIIVFFIYSPERLELVKEKLNPSPVYVTNEGSKKFHHWELPTTSEHYDLMMGLLEDERFDIDESALSMFQVKKEWETENLRLAQIKESPDPGLVVRGVQLTRYQQAAVNYCARNTRGVIINDPENFDRIKAAMSTLHLHGKYPILIVCDIYNLHNWEQTLKRLYPGDTVVKVSGIQSMEGAQISDYLILHYGLLETHKAYIDSLDWGAVVFDSAEKLKNEKSERSRAAHFLAANIPVKIALSSFDLSSEPEGLINILRIIGRLDDLGGFWLMANRYCMAKKNPRGGLDLSGRANLNELRNSLERTCYIRRT